MKKLLLLLPLFFVGCSNSKKHFVYCVSDINSKDPLVMWEGYAKGTVCTVVVNEKVYMYFKTPTRSKVVLDLSKMDCAVE